jgi:SnoaL-like polyketide cyclase
MGTEDNKALTRRFYEEVWGKGNTDFAFEVFADDYVRHDFRAAEPSPGPSGQKKIADDFRAAFPDLMVKVDLIIGEGEFVVGRWTATGTHLRSWVTLSRLGGGSAFQPRTSFASRTGGSRRSAITGMTSAFENRSVLRYTAAQHRRRDWCKPPSITAGAHRASFGVPTSLGCLGGTPSNGGEDCGTAGTLPFPRASGEKQPSPPQNATITLNLAV